MGDCEAREKLVRRLRAFATELRMEFQGRSADHVSRAIDEVALAVEQRRSLTLLQMVDPTPDTTGGR